MSSEGCLSGGWEDHNLELVVSGVGPVRGKAKIMSLMEYKAYCMQSFDKQEGGFGWARYALYWTLT